MTLDADTVSDHRQCGCCGRDRPARRVAELGVTPGVFICAGCALWAARRAGVMSALRQTRLRSMLPSLQRRRADRGRMIRAAIPVLASTDLDRTATFYAPVGFTAAERHNRYLLLHSGDVELHFGLHDNAAAPGRCFVFVADAAKLWEQLRHHNVEGVGPVTDQD